MKSFKRLPIVLLWLAMAIVLVAGTRTEIGDATLQSIVRITNNTGATVTHGIGVIPLSSEAMVDAALIDADTMDMALTDSNGDDVAFWPSVGKSTISFASLCDDDGGGGSDGDVCQTDGTFTSELVDAKDAGVSDVSVFTAATPVAGDAFVVCADQQYTALHITVGQAGVALVNWTIVWEYQNTQAIWTTLPEVIDPTDGFRNLGAHIVSWALPSDFDDAWPSVALDDLNNDQAWGFCVRARVTDEGTGPYIEPLISQIEYEPAVGYVIYTAADNTSQVSALSLNFSGTAPNARESSVQIFETGDKADSYVISVAGSSADNRFGGGAATVEFWHYPLSDGEGANGGMAQSKYTTAGGGYYIGPTDETTEGVRMRFVHTWDGADGEWSTTGRCPLKAWCHVAIVYSGSDVANVPTIYLNAIEETITTDSTPTGTVDTDAHADIYWGNYDGLDASYDGYIDEWRTFNDERTALEIADNYLLEFSGAPGGLMLPYIKFNDVYGPTATATFGSSGTLVRAMWESSTKVRHEYIPPLKDATRHARTGFTHSGASHPFVDTSTELEWRGYLDFDLDAGGDNYIFYKGESVALKTGEASGALDFFTWTGTGVTATEIPPSSTITIPSGWTLVGCTAGNEYQCIDEASPGDGNTSYIEDATGAAGVWERAVFKMTGVGLDANDTIMTGGIDGFRVAATNSSVLARGLIRIGTEGEEFVGTDFALTGGGTYDNIFNRKERNIWNSFRSWTPADVEDVYAIIETQGTAADPVRISTIYGNFDHRAADETLQVTGLTSGDHEIRLEQTGGEWQLSVDHVVMATSTAVGTVQDDNLHTWLMSEGGNIKWMDWARLDEGAEFLFDRDALDDADGFTDEVFDQSTGRIWFPIRTLDTDATVAPFLSTVNLEDSVQGTGTGDLVDEHEGDIEGTNFANTTGPSSGLPGYAFISSFASKDNLPIIVFYNTIWVVLMVLVFMAVLIIAPGGPKLFIASVAAGLIALLGVGVEVVEAWFLMIYAIGVVATVLLKEQLPI